MKTQFKITSILLLFFLSLNFLSCKDKLIETVIFTGNNPEYMSYTDLRKAVKVKAASGLHKPGKIYFYNNYLFINESLKGVHVVDNSDPASPQIISFVEIPGNVDISIKGNYMYADSYIDLVILDISDISNIHEVNRIENVFPYKIPEYDYSYPMATIDESKGVVTGWKIEEVKETRERNADSYNWRGGIYYEDMALESRTFDGGFGGNASGIGVSGSTARFKIFGDYIYLLHESLLKVYDINVQRSPEFVKDVETQRIAETIFLYDNKLFMGTQTGMRVYSVAEPSNPTFISEFAHIQSCDPVVVKDDYAYVTLRAGSMCGGISNQLDVIDISDIYSPELVKSYEMTEPHGLNISENILFVCDGSAGLKIYDASDPLQIDENLIQQFPDIHAFDVIPINNLIMMIGEDGLYQYNYTQGEDMVLLSIIPVS